MANSKTPNRQVLENIVSRAHYLFNQMIYQANHRDDVEKGDPKVGGHHSASASALHIMSAIHLLAKSNFDHVANKPHASPADHSLNYLMDLFLDENNQRMSLEDCNQAMKGLRAFPKNGEPVFQSYHSAYDPDRHNFFPSGTVGIPPVQAGYLALAYRYAEEHGFEVPEAHFWAVMGDSEFREGSLFEAIPDFAERELGNLTWIVDYNRQSLDGHRITNKRIMDGTDNERIERTMRANGWDVIQVRHGSVRQALFKKKGGDKFKKFLEDDLEDFEFQALLLVEDMATLKVGLAKEHPDLKEFLDGVTDEELYQALRDLGGHDILSLYEALEYSKKDPRKPVMIIVHTLKGWGLKMAARPGNHSSLVSKAEVDELREAQGIDEETLFARFDENSEEGKFLKARGEKLYKDIQEQEQYKQRNIQTLRERLDSFGELPPTLDVNLKMASYPHTQWMLGQLTAKLSRFANTPLDESQLKEKQKALTDSEKPWKTVGELMVHMAPDVGTSTNLNPAMDGKIFGAPVVRDFEGELGVKDAKLPDLVPGEDLDDRYIRFEIAEGNVMSCMGSFGKMRDLLGIPLVPLMTVYDFFVKRALDQFFYDLYWRSSFILVGTPSGVTLSPEGAQHGWKSDIQIPNQITWEPFYCVELDWIFSDALKRHVTFDNEGRSGVFIRGVTRGAEQRDLMTYLKRQAKFKQGFDTSSQLLCSADWPVDGATVESEVSTVDEAQILEDFRHQVLQGAYYLIDYRNYAGYEPGDNVVNIFAMGSLGTEAIAASNELLSRGIYANVIMVTCPDLVLGNLAAENDYHWLRHGLGVNSNLYIQPKMNGHTTTAELVSAAGRRIPIVSVHDGEPGLLDNIGSVIGVRHETLAVRKHSRCGRPRDIYQYHKIDAAAVVEACGKVLAETALESVEISQRLLSEGSQQGPSSISNWRELWPETKH